MNPEIATAIWRLVIAKFLQNAIRDIVNTAGLVHEHAEDNAKAGYNTNAAKGRTELGGYRVRDIRKRHAAGYTCSVCSYQQCYESVQFQLNDTEQQHRD